METSKLLASVDSAKISNAYYDESSRHMNLDDLIFNNRFRAAFSTLNFGSSNSFNIPNDNFVSHIVIPMRFKGLPTVGENKLGIVPLPAYTSIDYVEITIGGSTVYKQTGINMLFDLLASCDSKSKRDELIRFAGGNGGLEFQTDNTYYAFLNLPWSSMSANIEKLPLDSKLFTQQITINLYLKQNTSVYYASSGVVTLPTTLVEAEFNLRQGELKDKSKRLKLVYSRIGAENQVEEIHDTYSYPFTYSQSAVSGSFQGTLFNNTPNAISLSGFKRGNLQAIRFMLYNNTTSTIGGISSSVSNILKTEDPINAELSFNGQVIFRSRYDSWKASNLCENNSDMALSTTPSGTSSYSLLINMVDFLEKVSGEKFQSGLDLSSQTLIFSLNTPTTDQYVLYITYLYHCHILCDGINAEYVF